MNSVFVVLVSDEDGENPYIHSIYSMKDEAEDMVKRLNSSLNGMNAYWEEHELS